MIDALFEGIRYRESIGFHSLPANARQMEALLLLTRALRTDAEHMLELRFRGHDDPGGICLAWQGEGYRMLLLYPMEDFGWPNPLVLCGEDLTQEETEEILRGVCLERRETESFPIVQERFRDVTARAFGEFAPREDLG